MAHVDREGGEKLFKERKKELAFHPSLCKL